MAYLGTSKIKTMYLGDTKIAKAYFDANLVYQDESYDTKIAYLKSNGTQFIDTGFIITELDVIEIEAEYASKSGDNFLLGASGYTGEGSIWLEIYANAIFYTRFGATTSTSVKGVKINTKYSFVIEKDTIFIDGMKYKLNKYSSMPNRTLVIFGRNSSTVSKGNVTIYNVKIIRKKGVQMNLIPVRKGNTGYMYDTISGRLFGNNGTGDFILGPDVN